MLNENRVKLMSRMAAYESTQGKEDLRISGYYRKDYTSLNTLITILWITVGYAVLTALVMIGYLDVLMADLSMKRVITIGGVVIGVYIMLIIVYAVGASSFYRTKYNQSKKRVKQYYRDLTRLGKMYKKEK